MNRIELDEFEDFFSRLLSLTSLLCGKLYFDYGYSPIGHVGYWLRLEVNNHEKKIIRVNSDSLEYRGSKERAYIEIIECVLDKSNCKHTFAFSLDEQANFALDEHQDPEGSDGYYLYMKYANLDDKYNGRLINGYSIGSLISTSDKKKAIADFAVKYQNFHIGEHDERINAGYNFNTYDSDMRFSPSLILVAYDVIEDRYSTLFIQLNSFRFREEKLELLAYFSDLRNESPFLNNFLIYARKTDYFNEGPIDLTYSVRTSSFDRIILFLQQFAADSNKVHFSFSTNEKGLSLTSDRRPNRLGHK